LKSITVPFEHGNVHYNNLLKLAEFISSFGEDVIRFSMCQNIHLRNIPEQYLGNVYNFLSGLGIDLHIPLLLNSLVTCTGADTCRLGICLAKEAGSALRKELSKSTLDLEKLSDLKIFTTFLILTRKKKIRL
jgi:sulfite reductase (ferredoxin)